MVNMSQTVNNATINPYGKDVVMVETEFCGRKLTLEVNRVGFRTTASVLVRYGETVVLGTAMLGGVIPGMDYFPLSIDYEEKFYAAGKISGSRFIKREGKPSDDAVLIGRLIDRPIRPLWPKGYRNEVQGVASVLSMDQASARTWWLWLLCLLLLCSPVRHLMALLLVFASVSTKTANTRPL